MVTSVMLMLLRRPTPGISGEAVHTSEMGRRGHQPALPPRDGAGESFVSFIALLGCPAAPEPCLPSKRHVDWCRCDHRVVTAIQRFAVSRIDDRHGSLHLSCSAADISDPHLLRP